MNLQAHDKSLRPGSGEGAHCLVLAGQGEQMKLLTIHRKYPPFALMCALPGGHVEQNETPLMAALRELREETGLRLSAQAAIPLSPRKKMGDLEGKAQIHPFLFCLEKAQELRAGDDALDAQWTLLKDLPALAFDQGAVLCEALGKFWPNFPSYAGELANIKSPFPVSHHHEQATFFGGSFNPWHEGHTACLELFPQKENLIVIPDQNPQKNRSEKSEHHCYFQSFLELRKQTQKYNLKIFPGFWGMERPNPTVNWLPQVKIAQKYFLMGADTFLGLATWSQPQKLLRELKGLWVVPRGIEEKILRDFQKELLAQYPHLEIKMLPHHAHESLSSSKLRK